MKPTTESEYMPEKGPEISVILIDGSFRESCHAVEFFEKQKISRREYEIIWVEYYERTNSELKKQLLEYENLKIVELGKSGIYHSSLCFNRGIMESRGRIIVIADGDTVVEEDFLDQVRKEHKRNDELVMYVFRLDEPEQEPKGRSRVDLNNLRKICRLVNPSNYGACLTVRKQWLLSINGYEEHPFFGTGFHANGLDVYTRLKNLGLSIKWHPDLRIYHPWHPLTLSNASVYELQHMIIEHRAITLSTLPFCGIYSDKNSEIPGSLSRRLNEVIREKELASSLGLPCEVAYDDRGANNGPHNSLREFGGLMKRIGRRFSSCIRRY